MSVSRGVLTLRVALLFILIACSSSVCLLIFFVSTIEMYLGLVIQF